MATVEPEELKKKTKMVAYDTLSKGLTLGKAKKSAIFFAFHSLNRTLPLRGEGTHARESKKICDFFCFPLA